MKSITYQKAVDTFTLQELPVPTPETELDVVVKVYAVGLNPVDAKIHLWHGMVPDMDNSFIPGLDVSGEIVAVGAGVTDWNVGDEVVYHGDMRRVNGGFSEYSVQDCRTLVKKPDVSHELAASTPCAAWTAYHALHKKLRISGADSIFIAGGAGGVGSFAIQFAKLAGVKTIITTSSAAKHEYVKSLGATHTIDYRTQDVVAEVMQITQEQGVEFALDCVGGQNALICSSVLGFEGSMAELVTTVNPTEYPDVFMKALSFHQVSLGSGHVYGGDKGKATIVDAGKAVSQLLASGDIEVPEMKVISLDEIPQALKEMREERTLGKVVARIAD